MTRSIQSAIAVLVTIVASLGVALAEEPARPWTDTADFGLVLTGGNTKTFNVSLSDKFIYKWTKADFTLDALALYGKTTTREPVDAVGGASFAETDTTTAEMYGLSGKYARTIREDLFWYASAGWMSNKLAGIDNRYGAGGGIGYRFFKTDLQTLSVELGVAYTSEKQTSGFSDSYAEFRAFLGYLYNISKTAKFTEDFTVLDDLSHSSNFRANSISAVTASLTAKLALKVSLALLYDNEPVVVTFPSGNELPYEKLDTILTAALVINF